MTGISALPLAQEEGSGRSHQRFRGVSRIVGPQWLRLPTLTIGLLGVQIFWSVEMSYASPYLLSLGLSKSQIAIVFVAGPLSGLIMHPLIGVLADNCTSRFGRRRPYMMVGTIICIVAMLLLGFTRWFAAIFTGWNNTSNDLLTIWLAVFAICFVDFSINAVMAVDRALLVDTLPSSSQPQGNAWAARMMAVGAVIGFFAGNVDLTTMFPLFGRTQLQALSVIASCLLLGSHLVMAVLIKERILLPNTDAAGKSRRKSLTQELKDIWSNMLTLPRVIRQICFIQFFAWLGWFPVLSYTTLYIGDLYKRSSPVPLTAEAQITLDAEATRLGTRALFWSSVVWLISNVVLPAFVTESASSEGSERELFECSSRGTWWSRLKRLVKVPQWMKMDMATLWTLSHLVFAGCMFATFLTSSVTGATFMIAVTGFPWAVAQWTPFSLLGTSILMEISDDDNTAIRLSNTRTHQRTAGSSDLDANADVDETKLFLSDDVSDSDDESELEPEGKEVLGDPNDEDEHYRMLNGGCENGTAREVPSGGGGLSEKAGIILGIHIIFIVIPQFLITGFSSLIFAIFDPKKVDMLQNHHGPIHAPIMNATDVKLLVANGTEPIAVVTRAVLLKWLEARQDTPEWAGDGGSATAYEGSDSLVYIFRFGGVAAVVAALLSWKLARELRHR
ncbi:MFS general substrate transporter [Macrolepiota fuliginosa MF-IS2]|uniref:MFS general substrate transporter n=1 Tax=Macrolepiota fuliginosa MF-IS2 TaxID=1400762 RepID=A0A9P5X3D6_9AGAR|nr:MFS general substrate transporter [Macrolepiota fuliginosa MF-IS2]